MSAKNERLYFKLQIAAQSVRKASDRALGATGLTTAQTGVLLVVRAEQPVTQRSVARKLRLQESAVTAMVARLYDLGYVQRLRDEADARRRLLAISPEGDAALGRSHEAFDEINGVIESALTSNEIEVLAALLERVGEAFVDGGSVLDDT